MIAVFYTNTKASGRRCMEEVAIVASIHPCNGGGCKALPLLSVIEGGWITAADGSLTGHIPPLQ